MIEQYIIDAIEGLLIGVLATIVLLFSFQSYIPYPAVMVKAIEHPWIIAIAFICAILIGKFSPKISVLLILLLISFVLEVYLFTRPMISETHKQNELLINKQEQYIEDPNSPVNILSSQSTSNALPNELHKYNNLKAHVGYPLYDVLLPAPLYSLFDTVQSSNIGLINGGVTN